MKRLLFYLCTLFISTSVFAQQTNPRLIVRADDLGVFHSVNAACIEAYKNGIVTSVEVMPVTPWFPEAVKMLHENLSLDVGVHLTITSEWENIKWRPLTHCPSLTDKNGYFYPMMTPTHAYPKQSVMENDWKLSEIEQEFRAQIELALKNIPQISHLTGHMGAMGFDPAITQMIEQLADEYNLPAMDRSGSAKLYHYSHVSYDGAKVIFAEKETSFIRMLENLEPDKTYLFLDHPALNNSEMQTVGHIGYEDVAVDRQEVTDLFTGDKIKQVIRDRGIELISYNDLTKSLPRSTPAAEKVNSKGISNFVEAFQKSNEELHSYMIVRNGKVVAEEWFGNNAPDKPHVMYSVSKTYTATAVGFAVNEGLIKVTDKVISFFPDKLPVEVNDNLKALEIRHLLMMSSGHDVEPRSGDMEKSDWLEKFFAAPFVHKPGSVMVYNSLATYVLSAVIQKVTGKKLIDYLYPRLFRPLGIVGATWYESPQGINAGGWGLSIKTEDMAKLGLFILQKGKWNGKQLIPESWFNEATTSHIESLPSGTKKEDLKIKTKDSDWLQGYGYQMWRSRHNSFRADGAYGQYILILPDKNTVIAITAQVKDMQAEINLVWKYLLPALR